MTTEALATHEGSVIARAAKMADLPAALEKAVIQGDLTYLTVDDRVKFYAAVCNSVGLNPLTQPFLYVQLNGKLKLYASKDATDQLRKIHGVSVTKLEKEIADDLSIVTAYGCDKTGRTDAATGVVPLIGLRGEAKANALMKSETKAKRRLTLSLCGLGMLDETEIETIPGAKRTNGEATVEPVASKGQPMIPPPAVPVPAPILEAERPANIDADGVVAPKKVTTADTRINGHAQALERAKAWPPEIAAIVPTDEADYLMADPDAEANRELYATGIRDMAKRRKLSAKEVRDLREMFFGAPTATLEGANIYVLRALWKYLDPEHE